MVTSVLQFQIIFRIQMYQAFLRLEKDLIQFSFYPTEDYILWSLKFDDDVFD